MPQEDEDEEEEKAEGGGLLIRLDERRAGVPTSAAAVAERWFAQDLFADPDLALDDDDGDGGGGVPAAAAGPHASPLPGDLRVGVPDCHAPLLVGQAALVLSLPRSCFFRCSWAKNAAWFVRRAARLASACCCLHAPLHTPSTLQSLRAEQRMSLRWRGRTPDTAETRRREPRGTPPGRGGRG